MKQAAASRISSGGLCPRQGQHLGDRLRAISQLQLQRFQGRELGAFGEIPGGDVAA